MDGDHRRRAAWLAAFIALFLPLSAQALPANTWVVSIGENHGSASDVELLYAERDAKEMADALRQHGRVSSRRMSVLLGEPADTVRRTLQEVNVAIRAVAQQSDATALVVFYSGHADAEALHMDGSTFALQEIKTLVEGSPASMRLLIVDACRSGTFTRVKGVAPAPSFPIDVQSEVAPEGVAIITSSAANESSQESDALRGSFFTNHFVNALRGAADKNSDGKVTLNEAYAYAYTQTLRSSGQTMALQHPTYSWTLKGRDQLVLSTPGETQGRMGRLRLDGGSSYLIMEKGEGGPIIAELSTPGEMTDILLPAGHYFVQRREPNEYREYDLILSAGGEASLANLRYRAVRYDQLVRRRGGPVNHLNGLTLLGGARGGELPGEGITPQAVLSYGIDFDWGSLAARLRYDTVSSPALGESVPRRHTEIGLGLTVSRYVDVGRVTLGFGLLVEGVRHFQIIANTNARHGWGASFGGLLSAETHLGAGFAVRLEAGPMSGVFEKAVAQNGAQVGKDLATPLTWWAAGGFIWRH
jgi:hypothetical protein